MEFGRPDHFSDDNFEESIGVREIFEKYMIYLKWFVVSIFLCGLFAFLKLRYEVPKYSVVASILIKDQDKGSSFSDMASFENFGLFGSGTSSLENEIQLLRTRRLMTKVVEELKLNTRYFIEESPYDKEQYPNFPVVLNIKSDSSSTNSISTSFEIYVKSNQKFEFIGFDDLSIGDRSFGQDFYANLGSDNRANKQLISISLNTSLSESLIGKTILIKISPVNIVVNSYMQRLRIEPVNEKMSEVLTLSIEETVREKGIAIINNLIEQFNADGINDQNEISQNTTDFLDLRLGLIATELGVIEGTAEQFKTKNRMVDVKAGGDYFLESSSLNERELVSANTQMELTNYMFEELKKSNGTDLLPGNIGLSNPEIIRLVSDYNNLILQRNRILKSSSERNPIVVNLDSQLEVLNNNIVGSLNSIRSSMQIQINSLNQQSGKINSRIASVPKNEREYKDIVRQQETKNALYLFLLQKREESILSDAVNVEKAKVLDNAYSDGNPVSPKKKVIYLISIMLGFFVPVGIIYVKDLLDTKVHDEKDLRKLKIPYLGDVPLTSSKKELYISDYDNSNIAEAFRYLRTNINFMLDNKERSKIIFVTSTRSHEGKTFTAINLASSLAMSGKKTLLLAMDLRAPKISKYLKLDDKIGITNFIKDKFLTVDDIIEKKTKFEKLHLINSGDIPPNPVELLMSPRIKELFDGINKEYDYIIVDTAPAGMVTDTIQISQYADLTIYVVKANYLDKRMLHIPEKLHKENKLQNMAILINGSDHSKGAYGYGYGYGYGELKKKSFLQKIKLKS